MNDYAATIDQSGFLNESFYRRMAGLDGSLAELLDHYVSIGERAGIPPSPAFNPKFYLASYPDVERANVAPLEHFIKHGRAEGRYGNEAAIEKDVVFLLEKGVAANAERARRHLLSLGPVDGFDPEWYARTYRLPRGVLPIVHYARRGRAEGRVRNEQEFEQTKSTWAEVFSPSLYSAESGLDFDDWRDALDHFVSKGYFEGFEASEEFSEAFYLDLYADLRDMPMSALRHFIDHGRAEGRRGTYNPQQNLMPGRQAFDESRQTILIAVHEASRTGAPLLAWALGRVLSEQANVIFYLDRTGSLMESFLDQAVFCVPGESSGLGIERLIAFLARRYALSAIIANSIETSPVIMAAAQTAVPVVALIHEFAGYAFPRGKLSAAVRASSIAVFPAQIVADAAQAEIKTLYGSSASNIIVRPQGRLPKLPSQQSGKVDLTREEIVQLAKGKKIVLGAGAVQIRKGVDIFVQTAAEVLRARQDICFFWVGFGYDPLRDPGYSIWVKEMIDRAGLTDSILFIPEQQEIDAVLAAADLFFLSSRLDPFPNVGIDALAAGKYVVCFEGATGLAEQLAAAESGLLGAVARHCSPSHAAELICDALDGDGVALAKERNRAVSGSLFDFQAYVDFLLEQVERAQQAKSEVLEALQRVSPEIIDHRYYGGNPSRRRVERSLFRDFAIGQVSGLVNMNPRRGYSDNLARTKGLTPYDGVATHRCYDLSSDLVARVTKLKTLVHVHLHYSDLAFEMSSYLTKARVALDLYITTTSELAVKEIAYAFRLYEKGMVEIRLVPNRGRDVAPLLGADFATFVFQGQYDVVYHLHGKKSLATDATSGDHWRAFLLKTFLNGDNMVKTLGLFAARRELGLVFAEDRHNCGWTDNYDNALGLAAKLRPTPVLPVRPFFPLGTMFAFRPQVLKAVWALGLTDRDFPVEPIPEDGTIMHAFERMLPAITEAQDLSWCTVSDPSCAW